MNIPKLKISSAPTHTPFGEDYRRGRIIGGAESRRGKSKTEYLFLLQNINMKFIFFFFAILNTILLCIEKDMPNICQPLCRGFFISKNIYYKYIKDFSLLKPTAYRLAYVSDSHLL